MQFEFLNLYLFTFQPTLPGQLELQNAVTSMARLESVKILRRRLRQVDTH